MNKASVTKEIHALIDEKLAAGVSVRAEWIASGILKTKNKISGRDKAFYRVCAYRDIVRIAKRAIGKYDTTDATPEQLVFPGFTYLCKAYTMERDGKTILVPIGQSTEAELLARAEQLNAMAIGCRAHATEIRAYVAAKAEAA